MVRDKAKRMYSVDNINVGNDAESGDGGGGTARRHLQALFIPHTLLLKLIA